MSKKNNIDKVVVLYDLYKELLTTKQRKLFESYYFNDLSLMEISKIEKITRSAVHDSIDKTVNTLIDLEIKLNLSKKNNIIQEIKKEAFKEDFSLEKLKKILK